MNRRINKLKAFFKRETVRKYLYFFIMAVLVGVFVYSAYSLYQIYAEYKKGKDTYDDLAGFVVIDATPEPDSEKEPEETDNKKNKHTSEPQANLEIDFETLKNVNEDVIGWIYCPDTVINYPIVQGDDNNYYLTHLFDKSYNICGTPFLDFENKLTDDNLIFYSHHMKNGSMFASIVNYESQSYFEEHPYVYIIFPDAKYRVDLFSGYVTKNTSNSYITKFYSKKRFSEYLSEVIDKSNFSSNVDVTENDKIVTLSTCTYDFKDARYVLHGKLEKVKNVKK